MGVREQTWSQKETILPIGKNNEEDLPSEAEAYYEDLAGREELYLEETEEHLRMTLISDDPSTIPKQDLSMTTENNNP